MNIQQVYLYLHDIFCNILIFFVYVKIQLLTLSVSFLPHTRLDI